MCFSVSLGLHFDIHLDNFLIKKYKMSFVFYKFTEGGQDLLKKTKKIDFLHD